MSTDGQTQLALAQLERRRFRDEVMASDPAGRAAMVAQQRAEALAMSLAIVNKALANPGAALLLVGLADDIGVSPGALARYAYVVQGSLTFSAQGQLAIAKRAGHIKAWRWDDVANEQGHPYASTCILTLPDDTEAAETVTMHDYQRGGWKSDQWGKAPATMLRWRAASYALKFHVPDLFLGPTREELDDARLEVVDTGQAHLDAIAAEEEAG